MFNAFSLYIDTELTGATVSKSLFQKYQEIEEKTRETVSNAEFNWKSKYNKKRLTEKYEDEVKI